MLRIGIDMALNSRVPAMTISGTLIEHSVIEPIIENLLKSSTRDLNLAY